MADTSPFIALRDFAGVRNDRLPQSYEAIDLIAGVNVDLVDKGSPVRRDGYTQRLSMQGAHSLFATADQRAAYYAQGSGLYSLAASLASGTQIAAGLSPGFPLSYAEHAGRVYWSNGVQSGVIDGGRARGWGLPQTPPVALAQASGVLPAGTYQVACTYLRADGQESGCGAASVIELPSGGGIAVTLPVTDHPDVTGFVVYMTSANGTQLYEAARVARGITELTLALSTDTLQRPLLTQFYGPPPAGQAIAVFRGRMFIAVGPLVYYSPAFGMELSQPLNFIPFASNVRMLAPVTGGLYVSDETTTYFCSGTDPEQFTITPVQPYPAIAGSVVYAPAGLLLQLQGETPTPVWLSAKGVVVGAQDGGVTNVTERWRFAPPARASAMFRQNGAGDWQYLATLLED